MICSRDKERMFRRRQKGDLSNTSTGKLNSRLVTFKVWHQSMKSGWRSKGTERKTGKKKKGRKEDREKESEKTLQEREIRKFSRRGKTWLRNLEASVKRIVPAEEDGLTRQIVIRRGWKWGANETWHHQEKLIANDEIVDYSAN